MQTSVKKLCIVYFISVLARDGIISSDLFLI